MTAGWSVAASERRGLARSDREAPELEPAAGEPIIRIRGLSKRFPERRSVREFLKDPFGRREVPALCDVSLDIPRGGFFGLLGPNGAGKTTLFKILATLVWPDAGSVEIDGIDGLEAPAAVRETLTPVIADERSLDWRLSGRENLRLYASLYGLAAATGDQRIDRLLGTVGLEKAAERMVGTYSSGMKQRLLIARALLSRPSVLLLDEPTRSLDPISARDFREFLREEVAGRQRCTVVLATHDGAEAFELCGKLAVLDRGRLVASGSTEELGRMAGNERCRITVHEDDRLRAARALERAGMGLFSSPSSEAGRRDEEWVAIEGPAPTDAARTAELTALLSEKDVRVAEVRRVDLPLAELIEQLVARQGTDVSGEGRV